MSISPSRFRGALIATLALSLFIPAVASAAAERSLFSADLRVVDSNGDVLADHTQFTAAAKVKTDPDADCFGPDTGGSGDKVKVAGATALGLLASGTGERAIRPLSITDAFDFGLGLCGIGKAVAPSTGFWYLKKNHVGSLTGGDQTAIEEGDEIVWFLVEDFTAPPAAELVIDGPVKARTGKDIKVTVHEYADDGSRSAAEGVQVTGADELTDAQGKTTIQAADEPGAFPSVVGASRDGAISDVVPLCVSGGDITCTTDGAVSLIGSAVKDRVKTEATFAVVRTHGGKDKVDLRGSENPELTTVDCGGSKKDKVIVDPGAEPLTTKCERVIER